MNKTKDIIKKIQEKNITFTVTTGRSGTGYLSEILNYSAKITSLHEPHPKFNNNFEFLKKNPDAIKDFLLNEKLPSILAYQSDIYIETSHLFCKGFLEPLMKMEIYPNLIFLNRNKREVAISLLQLITIPGRTENGLNYLICPNDDVFLKLPDWEKYSDYQICYWYTLEIEGRQKEYRKKYNNNASKIVEITLDELKIKTGFKRLINELDLPKPSFLRLLNHTRKFNRPVNTKEKEKVDLVFVDYEAEEQELIYNIEMNEEATKSVN